MARISARIKGSLVAERETFFIGAYMAELITMKSGRVIARSLAPTRKMRRAHESLMKKAIGDL